jgi:hypothetical protein
MPYYWSPVRALFNKQALTFLLTLQELLSSSSGCTTVHTYAPTYVRTKAQGARASVRRLPVR